MLRNGHRLQHGTGGEFARVAQLSVGSAFLSDPRAAVTPVGRSLFLSPKSEQGEERSGKDDNLLTAEASAWEGGADGQTSPH